MLLFCFVVPVVSLLIVSLCITVLSYILYWLYS